MSFKDKLLDYCENYAKHDCSHCGFFKQCNHISETRMPNRWREDEFKVMHSELVKYGFIKVVERGKNMRTKNVYQFSCEWQNIKSASDLNKKPPTVEDPKNSQGEQC